MLYGLIRWGGQLSGQRPRTALARIFLDERGFATKARIIDLDGTPKYKRALRIDEDDVLYWFDQRPIASEVRAAKLTLPIWRD